MTITIQEIQNLVSAYEAQDNFLKNVLNALGEQQAIRELKEFCQHRSKDATKPLDEEDLYHLCKILFTHPSFYGIYKNLVPLVQKEIGHEAFLCLQALYQHEKYNYGLFKIVRTWDLNLSKLNVCLNSSTFLATLDLVTQSIVLTRDILVWLMNLKLQEITALREVLIALDQHKALNIAFFPIFIYYGSIDIAPEEPDEYHFDKGWLHLIPSFSFSSPAKNEERQRIFGEFVKIINSPALVRIFEKFASTLNVDPCKNQHYLFWPQIKRKRADIPRVFIKKLIVRNILTPDRFNYILSFPEIIPSIDEFISLIDDPYSPTWRPQYKAIIQEHFDILMRYILTRFSNRGIIDTRKFVEFIFTHQDSFRKTYTPFIIKMNSNPLTLIQCMEALAKVDLLREDIFFAIVSNPVPVSHVIIRLNEFGIPLNNQVLTVIKKHSKPSDLCQAFWSMPKSQKSQIETYLNDMYKKIQDKEEIMQKLRIFGHFRPTRNSYFSLFNYDVLKMMLLYNNNGCHFSPEEIQKIENKYLAWTEGLYKEISVEIEEIPAYEDCTAHLASNGDLVASPDFVESSPPTTPRAGL